MKIYPSTADQDYNRFSSVLLAGWITDILGMKCVFANVWLQITQTWIIFRLGELPDIVKKYRYGHGTPSVGYF